MASGGDNTYTVTFSSSSESGCSDFSFTGTFYTDCLGVYNGAAQLDQCGVCDGDGIGEGECDCEGNVFDCAGNCPSEISVTLLENENECVGDYSTSHGGAGGFVGCEDGGITFEECVQICIDNPNCNGFGFGGPSAGPHWGANGCDYENGLGPCNPQVNNYCDSNWTWDWYGISYYQESYEDDCGVCDGDNSSCADECGVPNGDNSSCADCAGVPNGDSTLDNCGVCDGDNST